MAARQKKITASSFYSTYHGHELEHLETVVSGLRSRQRGLVFLAGDSSLDNKYWLRQKAHAVNGYEELLDPPNMMQDVNYWLNVYLEKQQSGLASVNTAIEESTLGQRERQLLPQDVFIRDHLCQEDCLVVSVGGNDVALRPSISTIISMLTLVNFARDKSLAEGNAWGMKHFIRMFRDGVAAYVSKLVEHQKPKRVVVCMIYYPDELSPDGGSWADRSLSALRYNSEPHRLQTAIRSMFEFATQQIRVPGVEVVAVPLFDVLDGKNPGDYVERVEPSEHGGKKMAKLIVEALLRQRTGIPAQPGDRALEESQAKEKKKKIKKAKTSSHQREEKDTVGSMPSRRHHRREE